MKPQCTQVEPALIFAVTNMRIDDNVQFHSGDLESKQAEAARLKKERHEMEKKLKLYESKVLQSDQSDGESMAEKASAREAFLQQKRLELESR